VGDGEPRRLAVRRHRERHTGLDVFVVEGFCADVEEVIGGTGRNRFHVDHVVECLVGHDLQLRDHLRQQPVDGEQHADGNRWPMAWK